MLGVGSPQRAVGRGRKQMIDPDVHTRMVCGEMEMYLRVCLVLILHFQLLELSKDEDTK